MTKLPINNKYPHIIAYWTAVGCAVKLPTMVVSRYGSVEFTIRFTSPVSSIVKKGLLYGATKYLHINGIQAFIDGDTNVTEKQFQIKLYEEIESAGMDISTFIERHKLISKLLWMHNENTREHINLFGSAGTRWYKKQFNNMGNVQLDNDVIVKDIAFYSHVNLYKLMEYIK